MSNIVYIATSMDGYIAREDGNIDWLMEVPNPDNSDFGFSEFMERIDGIIMGRNTFETVVGFGQWPYTKPVYVLTSSLKELPENYRHRAEIVKGDLTEIVSTLKSKGVNNIYIDGGKTIQGFLKENLIDEIIITRLPILLGRGIPLFKGIDQEIKLKHEKTEVLNNCMVKSHYIKE